MNSKTKEQYEKEIEEIRDIAIRSLERNKQTLQEWRESDRTWVWISFCSGVILLISGIIMGLAASGGIQ